MIDLHLHILPGIDDGAQSWDDAAEMAQIAVESGVRAAAATSHSNLPEGGCAQEAQRYFQALERFRRLLDQERIPLTVVCGMEIFAQGNFLERLKRGELLSLNHTQYILIEFPLQEEAFAIYRALAEAIKEGWRPVVAHPERYACVQKVPAHVYEWYRMGAVIQINKGSVLGRFGKTAQRTAESLLRHRLAAVAASDAHSPIIRTPELGGLKSELSQRYGEACAQLLLSENPRRILENKKVIWDRPVPYDYSRG